MKYDVKSQGTTCLGECNTATLIYRNIDWKGSHGNARTKRGGVVSTTLCRIGGTHRSRLLCSRPLVTDIDSGFDQASDGVWEGLRAPMVDVFGVLLVGCHTSHDMALQMETQVHQRRR